MKDRLLFRTNGIVCAVISAGFFLPFVVMFKMQYCTVIEIIVTLANMLVVQWIVVRMIGRLERETITRVRLNEQELWNQARLDAMTGFLNKEAFRQAVEKTLRQEQSGRGTFFILDIDCFKSANDRFGHAYGDEVIREFTAAVRSRFRHEDLFGRLGGDEFAVYTVDSGMDWAGRRAQELNAVLSRDSVAGRSWEMSASIGIAFYPKDGTSFDELYRHSDEALYQTKNRGRNGYALYLEAPPEETVLKKRNCR